MTNVTKYQKLQTALKAELTSGRFQVGDRFYTEREIMDKYQVSGITVARALSEMTEQGYFERKRKLGTFVKESPEMPGMSGCLMTRPLYLNRCSFGDDGEEPQDGISWFVVEEIRRGIINTYPGSVKIVDMDTIIREASVHPDLLTILLPQYIDNYMEDWVPPSNSIEIALPPRQYRSVNAVRPNYLVGVYQAMEHLIQLGHTRIAFLGRPELTNRFAAYRIAFETYGLPMNPEWICREDALLSEDDGAREMNRLLRLKNRPSAVFCGTDKLALGAMREALRQGIRIPEDLSMVGFDNISASSKAPVPLSTVDVPRYELGEAAVKLLFERLKSGKDQPIKTVMTNFIIRKSTATNKGESK